MEPAEQTIQTSLAGRIGSVFVTGLMALLGLVTFGAAIALLMSAEWVGGWILLVLSLFILALLAYVLRDARAKLGWRIVIGETMIELSLPANRSLIHRPEAFKGAIAIPSVRGVECYPESYVQLGQESLIEVWWLVLRDGRTILLAEDRGLASDYVAPTDFARRTGQAIADAAGVQVRYLPVAEGRAGILGVWGARPPQR